MTGVLSVWSRTPATLALTAAHLQQLSGGRFVLGLGASTAPIAEGFHGQPWRSPLGRLRDTCVAVRALLRGERLPAAPGGARPLRMSSPPATPVPIAVAGVTEPGIRLAGALADQWLPFLLPAPALEAGGHLISEAAMQAGRTSDATVTACIPLALGPDRGSAARLAASWLVSYTTKMGPIYPRVLREYGYHREIDALLEANPAPGNPVLPPAAERLAHDVLIFGTYGEARELSRRWHQHADSLALVAPFGVTPDHITDAIEAVAPAGGRAERHDRPSSHDPPEGAGSATVPSNIG
jgi:alkanesulfonate monooxygenase SsuD/methylene tetrahydromethanopterin reductase-like flavin-dependent oxidoreductase (luciferase family)